MSRPLSSPLTVRLSAMCRDGTRAEGFARVQTQASLNLLLAHRASAALVAVGDRPTFTLRLVNPVQAPLSGTLRVTLPEGASYVEGSATVNGAGTDAALSGRVLSLPYTAVAGGTVSASYRVTVLAGAATTLMSSAVADGHTQQDESGAGAQSGASNVATAQVQVTPGVFDRRGTLIGEVTATGAGAGPLPLAGVRLTLANGTQVLTDAQGRYTFRNLAPGPWLVTLDPATLPADLAEQPASALSGVEDVALLSRLDFALRAAPQASPPEAVPSARTGEQTGVQTGTLIVSPGPGTVLRGLDRIKVVLVGPAGAPLSLAVNGEAVAERLIGEETVSGDVRRRTYVGVPLRPGLNTLEARSGERVETSAVSVAGVPVRVELRPVQTGADGVSPIVADLVALDERGVPSGDGLLTVNSELEPLDPDRDPAQAGYQILLRGGVARLRLQPQLSARPVRVQAALGGLVSVQTLTLTPRTRARYAYQASFGVRAESGGAALDLQGRGYADLPYRGGQLQVAADSAGLPGLLSGGVPGTTSAAADLGRFPVSGSSNEAQSLLSSDLGVAFRYEHPKFSLGYFSAPVSLAPVDPLPAFSAARAEIRPEPGVRVQLYAGRVAGSVQHDTFSPDGSRTYRLKVLPQPGSESVILSAGGADHALSAGRDYLLDAATGAVVLAQPLGRYNADFVPQTLGVTYLPLAGQGEQVAGGVGFSAAGGGWNVEAAGQYVGAPSFGLRLGYRADALSVSAGYQVGPSQPEGLLSAAASYRAPGGAVGVAGTLAYSPSGGAVGVAELSTRLGSAPGSPLRLRLLHHSLGLGVSGASQVSDALLEAALTPALTLGGGLEYAWGDAGGLSATALARYSAGGSSLELSHAQPLGDGSLTPQTRLSGTWAVTDTTFLELRLARGWGEAGFTAGELGLRQTLGTMNYSVGYALPGASGESSRARFGLSAPISVSDKLGLTVAGSLLRDGASGLFSVAGSLGARYRSGNFIATASAEAGRTLDAVSPVTSLVLRGGASGTPAPGHTLSASAVIGVLPQAAGQFSLSHAWRGDRVAVLNYLRLTTDVSASVTGRAEDGVTGGASTSLSGGTLFSSTLSGGPVLEGETQLNVSVPAPWQRPNSGHTGGTELQPGLAYRLPLGGDGAAFGVQGSLGVNVPVLPDVGGRGGLSLGGAIYAFWQGTQDQGVPPLSLSLGLSARYTVAPGLRVVAGYTFAPSAAQGTALTPDARPGFSLRLDLFGGQP